MCRFYAEKFGGYDFYKLNDSTILAFENGKVVAVYANYQLMTGCSTVMIDTLYRKASNKCSIRGLGNSTALAIVEQNLVKILVRTYPVREILAVYVPGALFANWKETITYGDMQELFYQEVCKEAKRSLCMD